MEYLNICIDPALDIIRHWEGYRGNAYKDPVGVWTIGYGTTKYRDGTTVKAGDTCTKEQATEWLKQDVMNTRVAHILKVCRVPIENNELCALTSLVYNIGVGAFDKSTLLRMLNLGKPRYEVADQFLVWIHGGGRVLPGLVSRRKDERGLFLSREAHSLEMV